MKDTLSCQESFGIFRRDKLMLLCTEIMQVLKNLSMVRKNLIHSCCVMLTLIFEIREE